LTQEHFIEMMVNQNMASTIIRMLFILQSYIQISTAFIPSTISTSTKSTYTCVLSSAMQDEGVERLVEELEQNEEERSKLKQKMLTLSASYDRGYGATPSSRAEFESTINALSKLNPTEDARVGVNSSQEISAEAPLKGIWQMVYTTAQDVLLLNASPIFTIGAIYQVANDLPTIINVIDLIPRAQALLPPNVLPSLIRLEVTTSATSRESTVNRIGLNFETVQAQPKQILGIDTNSLPALKFNLPSIGPDLANKAIESLNLENIENPGYFDVIYLDQEMLIIQQNAPGGVFVLVKSDSYDP